MKRRLLVTAVTGIVALPVSYLALPGPAGADCVDIAVTSSIEEGKLHALGALADAYNGSGRSRDGVCATVTITGTTSGQARLDIRDGNLRPHVWTPTSSLWLELLRHETGRPDLPARPQLASITQSPLTIAMPRSMATELGWPARHVSWRDILDLAGDPDGWGAHDRPEWGRFSFGKDNPHRSTSGLAATVATYYAATGLSSDLRPEDINDSDVTEFVFGVEAGVHHYAEDAITFLERLADSDGESAPYVSAVVLEEQLVYEYNQGRYHADGARPAEPLVTLYPTDGTFMMDHPYVVMPWVTATERTAAADFLAFLQEPGSQRRLADVGFRRWDDAGDAWTLAPGIADSFQTEPVITDARLVHTPSGAVVAEILDTWDQLRKQANILFVLDVSGSMDTATADGRSRLEVVRDAMTDGLNNLPDTHRVGLWTFSDAVERSVSVAGLSANRAPLLAEIAALEADGGTVLYRAVREAHARMTAQLDEDRVNAVVVLTDGINTDLTDNDLDALLRDINAVSLEDSGRPSVRVFSIAFGDADYEIMEAISRETRASAYLADQPSVVNDVIVDLLSNF